MLGVQGQKEDLKREGEREIEGEGEREGEREGELSLIHISEPTRQS